MAGKWTNQRHFEVQQGCSIKDLKGTLHVAGKVVPSDLLDPNLLEQYVGDKFLKPWNNTKPVDNVLVENAPGDEKMPALPTGISPDGDNSKDAAVINSATDEDPANPVVDLTNKATPPPSVVVTPPKAVTHGEPFNFDPAALQGKSLEDLNIMISERDATIAPYASTAEAIAKLSQDHALAP